MKYILFTKKTKTSDGKYHSVVTGNNIKEADKLAKLLNCTAWPATAANINWLKNDQKANKNGLPSLPADFKI